MSYYYKEQSRTTDHTTDGRMSIGEVISLLNYLNSDTQRPWIEAFHYNYDETSNRSYLTVITMNDRPHNT